MLLYFHRWTKVFPLALLEAMAAARMVIASDVGSVKEVIRDQENGLLLPPGNLDALTSAMLSAVSNRRRLTRFGAAARGEVMAHYSSNGMVNRYADLYRSVAAA